jgi:ribosomal protein L11 methyltransferase
MEHHRDGQPMTTLTLFRLEITIDATRREEAVGLAFVLGASGVEVRDEETGHDGEYAVVISWHGGDPEVILARAANELGADVQAAIYPESLEGWETEVSACPRYLGRGIAVIGAGDPAPENLIPIRLNHGVGFGTGTHPTTTLCLKALEAMAAERAVGQVLDFGTGTGILAIAASKLGASSVVAIDIDQAALNSAAQNVALNDCTDITLATVLGSEMDRFDVVMANLYLGVLLSTLEDLLDWVKPDGFCVLTGFTDEHRSTIEGACADLGWGVFDVQAQEPWVLVRLRKNLEAIIP